MEFRLLGRFEAVHDGERIEAGRRQEKRLLAVLLLEAGRVLSVERLVDLLWDDDPPIQARASLHTHVSRLRSRLDPGGDGARGLRLRTADGGYLADVDPQAVDAHRFRALVERAGAEPDPTVRAGLLRRAVGMWRGPLLADLAGDRLRERVGAELTELRLVATEQMVEAELARGRHEALLGELGALCAEYPYRERLTGQLMRALYRAGRHVDALAAYQHVRDRLAADLGVDPGRELSELYAAVLRRDPKLLADASASASASAGAGAGAGAGTGEGEGPARAPAPAQLPGSVAGFTGRRDALKALDQLLPAVAGDAAPATIAVVTGTAGVGKTALVVHWAHQVVERFPDGQLYLNLRGYDATAPLPPTAALEQTLLALGHAPTAVPQALDGRAALYRSTLAGRRMLVVVDNARDADQVRPLLPGAAGCLTLVTSRDNLAGLVARDGARRITLDRLPDPDAAELLRRILGGERTDPAPGAVADLVRLCGGLPLALRVAAERAARRSEVPLADLVAELAGTASRLDAFDVPSDPTSAVRSVLSWSYRALPPADARLFRLLGLYPGADLTAPTAAALAGTDATTTRRGLDALAGAHLVEETGAGRYQLHDLLRAYAAELAQRHSPDAERQAARTRLLDHYLATADRASHLVNPHRNRPPLDPPPDTAEPLPLADAKAALAWYESERANLVAAVQDAVRHGRYGHGWQLPGRLVDYFDLRKRWTDWIDTHRLALRAARELGHRAGEGRTLNTLGVAYLQQGRYAEAVECYVPALAICRETGDRYGQCLALANLGIAYRELDRPDESLGYLREALDAFRDMGNRYGEGRIRNSLGLGYAAQGRLPEAVDQYRAALAIHREVGDRRNEGITLNNLGEAYRRMGRDAEAVTRFRQAVPILREVGDDGEAGETLTRLGQALSATGAVAQARECWREAAAIFERLGDPRAAEPRRHLAAHGTS